MHIGSRIKKIRESRNLSQKAVSTGIISTSHYSNVENGRFEPSSDVLTLLAERLEVPVSYFHKIHEENPELHELLRVYERLIVTNDEIIQLFLSKNARSFSFIPSLKQEMLFNLLKYLELAKFGQVSEAQAHYKLEIAVISKSYLENANLPLLEKYTYITGLYYFFSRDYPTCINYFKDSLHLTKDGLASAKINYNIALALYHGYDYGTALLYAKQALRLYMDLHCWKECGDCYNLVAALYLEQHKTDEAKKYIDKGISILAGETSETYANLFHNLALVFSEEKEYMHALETINRSIEVKVAVGSSKFFLTKKLKVEILFELGDFQTLQSYLSQVKGTVTNELDQAHLHYLEALLYHSMREYEQYELNMIRCISTFKEKQDWKSLKNAAHHFSSYYAEQKKYKSAYTYQEYCIQAYRHMMMESKGGGKD